MATHRALVVLEGKVEYMPEGDSLEGALPFGAQTFTQTFMGEAQVTSAGQEIRMYVGGPVGSSWKLKFAKIIHAVHEGSTGTTTLKIADDAVGGTPDNSMTFGVAIDQAYGTLASPIDFVVAVGTTLYISVLTTGLHSDVKFQLQLEQVIE